jgi:TolA-binding protein
LKKENERVVKENNELHRQLITLREDCDHQLTQLKAQLKSAQGERADLQFLSNQKDIKIQQLGSQMAEMQGKLEKVL